MGAPAPAVSSSEVSYRDQTYKAIREGLATILTPVNGKPQDVFYNPIQQYNRDLSVLAVRAYAEDLSYVRAEQQRNRRPRPQGKKRKRGNDCGDGDNARAASQEGQIEDGHSVKKLAQNAGGEEGEVKASNTEPPNAPKQDPQARDKKQNHPSPPFRILDALSATGLRALRYARELPVEAAITANDLSSSATSAIKLNVDYNELQDRIQVSTSDAIDHMHHSGNVNLKHGDHRYEVIDLDPYGTAAPFLDAAVKALSDGGLLCVTCTDAGIFASTGYLEKTFSQYGGLPISGPHAHEGGIRLILQRIATSAATYGIAIEPLLSLSIDFYARVFVRVRKKPAEVKHLAGKTMIVYGCDSGCGAWSIQHLAQTKAQTNKKGETIYQFKPAVGPPASPQCPHCGFKTHLAGPMWAGPLHNPHFIQRILDIIPTLENETYRTLARLEGMLTIALNEDVDSPDKPQPESKPAPAKQDSVEIVTSDTNESSNYVNGVATEARQRPIPPMDPSRRAHHPFFFVPSSLAGVIHCETPSDTAIRGALKHLGYRASRSHTKPGSIITDAPWTVIWEVMREWMRQKSPRKDGSWKEGTAGRGIMQNDRSRVTLRKAKETLEATLECDREEDIKEKLQALLFRMDRKPQDQEAEDGDVIALEADDGVDTNKSRPLDVSKLNVIFDEELGKQAQGKKLVSYQQNPANWGPMAKAKGGAS